MYCGRRPVGSGLDRLELHHVIGGTKGRSDERTNLIMLCRDCHEQVATAGLGAILGMKWSIDRQGTDWVRLAVLRRSFLPDLIIDERRVAEVRRKSLTPRGKRR